MRQNHELVGMMPDRIRDAYFIQCLDLESTGPWLVSADICQRCAHWR